jgi:hypothetical protein
MKRWLGLFAVLAVAALVVVLYLRRDTYAVRYAQIRPGMTEEEVKAIMRRPFWPPLRGPNGFGSVNTDGKLDYLEWTQGTKHYDGSTTTMRWRIYFGPDGRVSQRDVATINEP